MADQDARPPRRTYAVTAVLGLAAAALTAVAGSRPWASGQASAAGMRVDATVTGAEVAPLVAALGLVALAGWGVVLVTRGRFRRAVAALGLLAALGAVAAAVLGLTREAARLGAALAAQGAGPGAHASQQTPWAYAGLVAALVAAGTFAVAVRRCPGWPEMGSKYDAPAGRTDAKAKEPDMWRALDEGRDPTS